MPCANIKCNVYRHRKLTKSYNTFPSVHIELEKRAKHFLLISEIKLLAIVQTTVRKLDTSNIVNARYIRTYTRSYYIHMYRILKSVKFLAGFDLRSRKTISSTKRFFPKNWFTLDSIKVSERKKRKNESYLEGQNGSMP